MRVMATHMRLHIDVDVRQMRNITVRSRGQLT